MNYKIWLVAGLMTLTFADDYLLRQSTLTLEKAGFVNVQSNIENDVLIITYENRNYRSELVAAGKVIDLIKPLTEDVNTLQLITLNRGLPISIMEFEVHNNFRLSNTQPSSTIEIAETELISLPEFTLRPDIKSRFHTNDGLAIWKFNIAPSFTMSLTKGTQIFAEALIPILYQFDNSTKEIKLGSVYVNHTKIFSNKFWLSASTGIFHWKTGARPIGTPREFYRYGISAEVTKFWYNNRISFNLKADYTGHMDYLNFAWGYSMPDRFTWLATCGYRFSKPDVTAGLSWGKDLYQESPVQINIVRSFSEFDIGFYSRWYDLDKLSNFTGGITLNIPLPFYQTSKKGMLLHTARFLPWNIWYHDDPGGRYPETGTSIEKFYKRLFPTYIQNNQDLLIGGK